MTFRTAEEIISDREKGASELLEDVFESIRRMEEEDMIKFLEKLVKRRYSITPLVNLSNRIFLSIEKKNDIEKEIDELKQEFYSWKNEAVREMKRLLERKKKDKILTLSRSSTVIRSLSEVEKVVVLESRPLKEGRVTAKRLMEKGVDVDYWIDAGMCKAIEEVDCVVVGADTISIKGFLNKIGSKALAIVSENFGKKFFVVSDSSKILPKGIPTPKMETHHAKEVWDTQSNISVKNDYFELTELKRATFITEDGIKSSKDIKKIAEGKRVSERLLDIHPSIKER